VRAQERSHRVQTERLADDGEGVRGSWRAAAEDAPKLKESAKEFSAPVAEEAPAEVGALGLVLLGCAASHLAAAEAFSAITPAFVWSDLRCLGALSMNPRRRKA
jgi:hypothetical protein